METYEEKVKKVLVNELRRTITKLFKGQLTLLEDLRYDFASSTKKHENEIGQAFLNSFNSLDFEHFSRLRKKTLDSGNETIRDIENILENFEVSLKDSNKLHPKCSLKANGEVKEELVVSQAAGEKEPSYKIRRSFGKTRSK